MRAEPSQQDPRPAEPARRAPLPPAERRRRIREFWIGVVLIAAVGALLLVPPITGLTQGVGDSACSCSSTRSSSS